MTTIAYRDGVLAADSRGTLSDWVLPTVEQKLFRLRDGRVAAITGDTAEAMRLLEWIDGERKEPQPGGSCRVVVLGPGGQLEIFENGHRYTEHAPFQAWGTGMPVALGALHAGASAPEAVRIASLVDPYTGGAINWMACE